MAHVSMENEVLPGDHDHDHDDEDFSMFEIMEEEQDAEDNVSHQKQQLSAASNEHPAETQLRLLNKKFFAVTNKAEYLKVALLRRNDIIENLRTSYIKDVLTLKSVLNNVLRDDAERSVVMATYNAYIPCIDLSAALPTHSPEQGSMLLKPCEACGGQIDISISDADKLQKLKKEVITLKKEIDKLKVSTAIAEHRVTTAEAATKKMTDDHAVEKRVIYEHMQKSNFALAESKDEVYRITQENSRLRREMEAMREEHRQHNVPALKKELETNKATSLELGSLIINLKESVQGLTIELTSTRKALSREHERYAELTAAKEKTDMKLHQAEKDYELSVASASRLQEMNKELQKSLMLSNEKYYNLERQKAALEFESSALKDRANDDSEGLTSTIDSLRKDVNDLEKKLELCVEELKNSMHDKEEIEAALRLEIEAREKAIEDLEFELEESADSEEALSEELMTLKNFVKKSYAEMAGVADLHLLSDEEEQIAQATRDAIRQERADRQAERHTTLSDLRENTKVKAQSAKSGKGAFAPDCLEKLFETSRSSSGTGLRPESRTAASPSPAKVSRTPSSAVAAPISRQMSAVSTIGGSVNRTDSVRSNPTIAENSEGVVEAPIIDGIEDSNPNPSSAEQLEAGRIPSNASGRSISGTREDNTISEDPPADVSTELEVVPTAATARDVPSEQTIKPIDTVHIAPEDAVEATSLQSAASTKLHRQASGKASPAKVIPAPVKVSAKSVYVRRQRPGAAAAVASLEVTRENPAEHPAQGEPNAATPAARTTIRKTKMMPQEEPQQLKDLDPNSPEHEVSMRAGLMNAMVEGAGLNTTKKAINLTADFVHDTAVALTVAERICWNSLLTQRKFFDFQVKLKTVLGTLLDVSTRGVPTVIDVGAAITDMVPLVGMVGSSFSQHWWEDARMPEYITSLMGNGTGVTGSVQRTATMLPDLFKGEIGGNYVTKLEGVHDVVLTMDHTAEFMLHAANEIILNVVRDWGEAKAIFVAQEDILKKEGDRVRMIMAREVDLVKKELERVKRQLADSLLENGTLAKLLDDSRLQFNELKGLPEMVSRLKNQLVDLTIERDELGTSFEVLRDKFNEQHKELTDLQDDMRETKVLLDATTNSYRNELAKREELAANVKTLASDLEETQEALNIVVRREEARWAAGVQQAIQTDPVPGKNVALQTEFVVPELTLRTIMKRNKHGIYPVVMPDLSHEAHINEQKHISESRILQRLTAELEHDVNLSKKRQLREVQGSGVTADPKPVMHDASTEFDDDDDDGTGGQNIDTIEDEDFDHDDRSGISDITFNSSTSLDPHIHGQLARYPLNLAPGKRGITTSESTASVTSSSSKSSSKQLGTDTIFSNEKVKSSAKDASTAVSIGGSSKLDVDAVVDEVVRTQHGAQDAAQSNRISYFVVKKGSGNSMTANILMAVSAAKDKKKKKTGSKSMKELRHDISSSSSVASDISTVSGDYIPYVADKRRSMTAGGATLSVAEHREHSLGLTAEDFLHEAMQQRAAKQRFKADMSDDLDDDVRTPQNDLGSNHGHNVSVQLPSVPTTAKGRISSSESLSSDTNSVRSRGSIGGEVTTPGTKKKLHWQSSDLRHKPPTREGVSVSASLDGSTFLPSFHATSVVLSTPIHGAKRAGSIGGHASGSASHGTNEAGKAFDHEFKGEEMAFSPATQVRGIQSPFLDPTSKLNSTSIKELKKEFFGR